MSAKDDVFRLLGYIQDDLRQTQAKLVEVRSMLAQGAMERTPDSDEFTCLCGFSFRTARALALHGANVHNGPPVPMSEVEVEA